MKLASAIATLSGKGGAGTIAKLREGFGLEITERVPLEVGRSEANQRYLETKRDKLGHLLKGI